MEISNDQSGNYCVQKLLEVSNEDVIRKIVSSLCTDICKVCMNSYGSKVVQKAFDCLKIEHRVIISNEILNKNSNEVDKMIKDQHGNHVIQKIIEKGFCDDIMKLKREYNSKNEKSNMSNTMRCLNKILVNIRGMVYELCIHALGCRVVQKVIECLPSELLDEYI